jgi:hypothetical protein
MGGLSRIGGMGGMPGMGGFGGFMAGEGHMAMMSGQGHTAMMGRHMRGEGMPEACKEMMDDPEMTGHMMRMMHGEDPMSPDECQEWMTDHEVPAEAQAECLEHMAEHHQP